MISGQAQKADSAAGANKTAGRLDAILQAQNPKSNPFRNTELVEVLPDMVTAANTDKRNSGSHVSAQAQLALELLRAVEMEDSLKTLDKLANIYRSAPKFASGNNIGAMTLLEAMNYFRIGEVQNCFAQHGSDACLLPLRGNA